MLLEAVVVVLFVFALYAVVRARTAAAIPAATPPAAPSSAAGGAPALRDPEIDPVGADVDRKQAYLAQLEHDAAAFAAAVGTGGDAVAALSDSAEKLKQINSSLEIAEESLKQDRDTAVEKIALATAGWGALVAKAEKAHADAHKASPEADYAALKAVGDTATAAASDYEDEKAAVAAASKALADYAEAREKNTHQILFVYDTRQSKCCKKGSNCCSSDEEKYDEFQSNCALGLRRSRCRKKSAVAESYEGGKAQLAAAAKAAAAKATDRAAAAGESAGRLTQSAADLMRYLNGLS